MKSLLFLLFLGFTLGLTGQVRIHSHNDYAQQNPLYGALDAGASSIEIDIIYKDSTLFVAHELQSIKQELTLKSLYLDPLRLLTLNEDSRIEGLYVLIDIKTEAYESLNFIVEALKDLKPFSFPNREKGLHFVISGNRPSPDDYTNYPPHIFFDCQEIDENSALAWSRVAMISQSFRRYSSWKGDTPITTEDHLQLALFIENAKTFKIPVRLWAVPDTPLAWRWSIEAGLDYINTDQPKRVSQFLEDQLKKADP
jgi:alkaline phosphatase